MPEREPVRVVTALPVPCEKGGTAIISVWNDGAKTCSSYGYRSKLGGLVRELILCNSCPARSPNQEWNHDRRGQR